MASIVIHDHPYCTGKEKEDEILPFVAENQPESLAAELTELDSSSSLGLSPTYSCDSGVGVDSFAMNLVQELEKENTDLFSFLLDDQELLDLNADVNTDIFDELPLPKDAPKLDVPNSSNTTQHSLRSSTKLPQKVAQKSVENNDLTPKQLKKKNADNARENRRKKKEYVFGLEKEVRQLRQDKNVLIGKSTRLERKVKQLDEEVQYLKSVIENQSMLSKLLRKVNQDVSLSASFCSSRKDSSDENLENGKENAICSTRNSRKRVCNSQNQSTSNNAKRSRGSTSGGICLHVKQNKVSLEFCHICSKISED